MTTLTDVRAVAANTLFTFIDHTMLPAGHFAGTVQFSGETMPTVFLFEGTQDAPDAVVKGRIQYSLTDDSEVAYGYAQGGLTGGKNLGPVKNYKETFSSMV